MMLKRVFSSLAKCNAGLALRPYPLFRFSAGRDVNPNAEDDDFEFDFGKSAETKPRSNFRNQRPEGDTNRSFRGSRNFSSQPSDLLKAESLSDLTNLIEQQATFNAKFESAKLLSVTTQLMRKAPARPLATFKRSKAVERLYNEVLQSMIAHDKAYSWVMAYAFFATVKATHNTAWSFDRTVTSQMYSRVEQAVEDDALSEQDLFKVLRASMLLGHSLVGSVMRKISQKLLEVEGPLTAEQVSHLAFLSSNFSFTNDFNAWARKIVENKTVLLEEPLTSLSETYIQLKRAREHSELNELNKEIEDAILAQLESIGVKSKGSALKILINVPHQKLKRIRNQLKTKILNIIKEQPEALSYFDFVDLATYIAGSNDSYATSEIINAIAELSNSNPTIVSSKINAINDNRVLQAAKANNTSSDLKRAFGKTIVEVIDENIASSRSVNFVGMNFINNQELQAVLEKLPARASIMNDYDLKMVLLFARIRNMEIPESLREKADSAAESFGMINTMLPRIVRLNTQAGTEMLTKVSSQNLAYKDRINYTYTAPRLAKELLEPIKGKAPLHRFLDADANLLVSEPVFETLMSDFGETIKRGVPLMTLLRLDKLLNHNDSVAALRRDKPAVYANALNTLLEKHAEVETDSKHKYPQALIHVLSQSLDDELLSNFDLKAVSTMVNNYLQLLAESNNVNNFDVLRRLNAMQYNSADHSNEAYIRVLYDNAQNRSYGNRVIEHAFVAQQSYVAAGKLSQLDETYNKYYESVESGNVGFFQLKTLLKLLNKSDADLLQKFDEAKLKEAINEENAMQFVMIALRRYMLTNETTILNMIINHANSLKDIRVQRSVLIRIVKLVGTEATFASGNENVRELVKKLIGNSNVNKLLRKSNSGRHMHSLLQYMARNDMDMTELLSDAKTDKNLKSTAFASLISNKKQPELVLQLVRQNPADTIGRMAYDINSVVENVLMPLEGKEDLSGLYSVLGKAKLTKPLKVTGQNKYALLWLAKRQPEIVPHLTGKTGAAMYHKNYATDFVASVLRKLGAEVNDDVAFNNIKAAELVVGDKVLVADSGDSEVKTQVIGDLFPNKEVVNIKTSDIKAAATVEQLEELLKSKGLLTTEMSEEQKGEVTEMLNNYRNRLNNSNNKRNSDLADEDENNKADTSSSEDTSSSSSDSDSDNDADKKK